MEKILEEIKKILANKNTLTILIVIVGIIILYAIYNVRVEQAITTIKVPYAKKEITSRTKITVENLGYIELPKKIANTLGILTNSNLIIDSYVKYGNTIPENSFFYRSMITDFEEAAITEFNDIKNNYTVYILDVDINSTYGNSIYTGNYVDLYVKAVDDYNKIIFGKYIEGIQVLAVLDGEGNSVFESSSEARVPTQMWFAVNDEIYRLLKASEYISGLKVMPIPRNASYSDTEREAVISSNFINGYIQSKTINMSGNYSIGN